MVTELNESIYIKYLACLVHNRQSISFFFLTPLVFLFNDRLTEFAGHWFCPVKRSPPEKVRLNFLSVSIPPTLGSEPPAHTGTSTKAEHYTLCSAFLCCSCCLANIYANSNLHVSYSFSLCYQALSAVKNVCLCLYTHVCLSAYKHTFFFI